MTNNIGNGEVYGQATWRTAGKLRITHRIMTTPRLKPKCSGAAAILLWWALGLSACAINQVGLQGRWVGTVKPVSGTCDPASQAVLTIDTGNTKTHTVVFAPTGGVLALHGNSDGESQVTADLHTIGVNHQSYILEFNGTKTGDLITGTYINQRCRSEVTLHRE